jgi:predicted site-specific integrase-resolvase
MRNKHVVAQKMYNYIRDGRITANKNELGKMYVKYDEVVRYLRTQVEKFNEDELIAIMEEIVK